MKLLSDIARLELLLLFFLLSITIFFRFPGLGYSHFYGDETKALFYRKDVSAKEFLLNQRKGPMQFVVAWGMEKVSGGFDEGTIRLPFAIAGTLVVFVFYMLVRELFDWKIAFFSSLLFSMNGFFVAFSRTVQYQSFLLLFGLLSILFILYYTKNQRPLFALISAISLALAFLSHYDAIFFAVIVLGLLLIQRNSLDVSQLAKYFGLPFFAALSIFYFPYVMGGYFSDNLFGYIGRRISGSNFAPNDSLYTFTVYNPLIENKLLLLFSFFGAFILFKQKSRKSIILLLWVLIPFITFEIIFSNPGTHILNYLIPLIILSGVGIMYISKLASCCVHKNFFKFGMFLLFALSLMGQAYTFVPGLNNGYPWKDSKMGPVYVTKIDKSKHLFLYGFPYNRAWDKAAEYLKNAGAQSFYTNDNVTIAEFYLQGIPPHIPHPQQVPEYYVDVINNQEFKTLDVGLQNYESVVVYSEIRVLRRTP